MNLRILTSGAMLTFCLHLMPAAEVELTPGGLSSWLDAHDLAGETELVLNGSCDVRDFRALRHIPATVKSLRMESLRIESYTYPASTPGKRAHFPADELPEWALFDTDLNAVTLPSGLVSIGDGALASTSLRTLVIPEGVVRIGDYALYDNSGLLTVRLPTTLTTLGKGAMARCGALTDLDFTKTGLATIGEQCFSGDSSLTTVEFPATLRRVGREAFTATSIRILRLANVVELADYALSGMPRLEEAVLNARAATGRGIFMADGSLSRVTGATDSLPPLFAAGCRSLDPSGLAVNSAFIDNWALASTSARRIVLSPDLSGIGDFALSGIAGLEEIDARDLDGHVPNVGELSFGDADLSKITLYVADTAENLWREHPVWGQFNIVADRLSGIETPGEIPDEDYIHITADSGTLGISASGPIDSVTVYGTDGNPAASATPHRCDFSMRLPETERVAIVVVKAGNIVKTVKLTL